MKDNTNQSESKILLAWQEDHYQISPRNSETIHLTVANLGSEPDFFEISVKGVPIEWVALDKPVIQLGAGERGAVELTITVPEPPQSRAGYFPLVVQVACMGKPDLSETISGELTIAAFQTEGRIGMLLSATQFAVVPGSSINIPILLHNRGLIPDTFRLGVEGLPTAWISTASAQTRLEAGQQKEIEFTIQPPRLVESKAGRRRFKIVIHSQTAPEQQEVAECALGVAVFSEFSSQLQPQQIAVEQSAQILVKNEGNSPGAFILDWVSEENLLIFERLQREAIPTTSGDEPQTRLSHIEMSGPQNLRLEPGETGSVEFRARSRSRPIFGGEYSIPFTTRVQSSSNQTVTQVGEVLDRALIPIWVPAVLGIVLISFVCLFLFLFNNSRNQAASATQTVQAGINQILGATQTAAFNQTQAVISGQEDSDGDGLTNNEEFRIGTDPYNPDTDRDELLDGDEVKNRQTNPLKADTDGDGLSDGEEVLRRNTDPLNPDTDADRLTDGNEVQRGTNPLHPDSDQDALKDGDEVSLGTNPLDPDTDKDLLLDGQETPPCPDPLNPDSDGDSIIDGQDLDPCDPNNPSLTATAVAGIPTATPVIPATPVVTNTPTPTLPVTPDIRGTILFESNRDGNIDIYLMNAADRSVTRLTDNPVVDSQPALAPDAFLVAYVTNQANNNEIYLTDIRGQTPINLTNNAADDQYPTWSPDGNWIAFTTNRDGNQEIYIMRRDGSDLRNLSNHPANDFAPTWFRSGGLLGGVEWIAFTSDRDGNQEIYLVNPDGSNLRNLSNNPANDYSPSGSSNSEQITFVSGRDGNPEIYRMNLDGSNQINLTNNGARDFDPFFGPTSEWVAFTSERDGNLEIYVIRRNGESAFNLTQNPAQDSNPTWR